MGDEAVDVCGDQDELKSMLLIPRPLEGRSIDGVSIFNSHSPSRRLRETLLIM